MTVATQSFPSGSERKLGLFYVLMAGGLWSTVGLGIRLIEEAVVWQILLYRSVSLSLFLYLFIRLRTGESPLVQLRRTGWPALIAGLALVVAYAGGSFAIQSTTVANAMLLFATAPFMAAALGWIVLREKVRLATWIALLAAIGGVAVMLAGEVDGGAMLGNLAALGSAFGFAVFTVALRWGRSGEMLPSGFLSGIFGVVIMAVICVASVPALVLAGCSGGGTPPPTPPPAPSTTAAAPAPVAMGPAWRPVDADRKSTRLNSSH